MNTNYAGFWLRFVAVLIDGIIIGAVTWPVVAILGLGAASSVENMESMDEAQAMSMAGSMMAMGFAFQFSFFVIQ